MPIVSAGSSQVFFPSSGTVTLATLAGQTNTLLQAQLLATTQMIAQLDPSPNVRQADPLLAADLINLAQTDKVAPPTNLQ